jgi:molybdenum cofactor biosynthesis enzyme MoaA
MLAGQRPSSCQKCWDIEDNGGRSFRQIWNHILSESDTVAPRYLDITLGNKCNLTCRMCNEWNSHLWQIDNQRMGRATDPEFSDSFWFEDPRAQQLIMAALPTITHINFLGGEPLIVNQQMDLLQHCIDLGRADQIELSYNSNMTVLRTTQLSL